MSRKRIKQYLMLLTAVGLIAVAANGSGTFASFTAVVNNNGNHFSTGTLLLHQTADSGTTCASESNASNDETCQTLFAVDLSGKTAAGPLTSTISSGAAVTTIDVDSLSQNVVSGETVTIGSESFIASQDVSASASSSTTIPVLPQTAAATHSAGATVTADPSKAHYITLSFQNAGTLDASDLSVQSGDCAESNPNTESVGTITSETGASSPYTINVSGGLSIALPSGASLSDGTHTFTLSGAAVAGATSVTVTGTTAPNGTGSLLYAPTFGPTSLCDSTVQLAETDSTFSLGTTTACPLTNGGNIAADCADATETLSTLNADTNPTAEALSLNSGGNGNTGTGIDANGQRFFVLGVMPPSASGNDLQNKKAQFDITWQLDQASTS